jgi:polyhydroxyalkanoate synthase
MEPTPASVIAAMANLGAKVFGDGLADLRPVPRVMIDSGPSRSVFRLGSGEPPDGPPVLLVPPLAAPALCFDLRRGCSLAEYLVAGGRRTYLVDYGSIAFKDRALGFEHWIDTVLPQAIRAVSEDSGGRPVHLIGWCLGGIFSVLTAADKTADLPIASIATIAAPIDFTAIPLVAPIRPLVDLTGGRLLTTVSRALGGVPRPLARFAFQLSAVDKYVTKPIAMLIHLDDREFLAQIEAVDRFSRNMVAFPGRTFGQIYHRFFRANDLADGTVTLTDRVISLADVRVPTLVIAGASDAIAPEPAVRRLTSVLVNAPEVRFEVCPGGHLGVLTGRRARDTTWRHIDAFLDDQLN